MYGGEKYIRTARDKVGYPVAGLAAHYVEQYRGGNGDADNHPHIADQRVDAAR
ncbi:hypothetical protein D3C73_873840 [compost metagenome]